MARGRNRRAVDNNESQMPQVPKHGMANGNDDLEFAKELNAEYEVEQKPGFPPTGVRRKEQQQ